MKACLFFFSSSMHCSKGMIAISGTEFCSENRPLFLGRMQCHCSTQPCFLLIKKIVPDYRAYEEIKNCVYIQYIVCIRCYVFFRIPNCRMSNFRPSLFPISNKHHNFKKWNVWQTKWSTAQMFDRPNVRQTKCSTDQMFDKSYFWINTISNNFKI
jgi:hypothetical protein